MKIKSYFARPVEEALAAAGQERGPDAMLVTSRRAPPESGRAGEYALRTAAEVARCPDGSDPRGERGCAFRATEPDGGLAMVCRLCTHTQRPT